MRVWDTATGQQLLTLQHENAIYHLALSHDGHRLATQQQWNARGQIFDATPLPETPK